MRQFVFPLPLWLEGQPLWKKNLLCWDGSLIFGCNFINSAHFMFFSNLSPNNLGQLLWRGCLVMLSPVYQLRSSCDRTRISGLRHSPVDEWTLLCPSVSPPTCSCGSSSGCADLWLGAVASKLILGALLSLHRWTWCPTWPNKWCYRCDPGGNALRIFRHSMLLRVVEKADFNRDRLFSDRSSKLSPSSLSLGPLSSELQKRGTRSVSILSAGNWELDSAVFSPSFGRWPIDRLWQLVHMCFDGGR